ncbi:DUF4232 domain-containing protein [Streptomyces actinomycinicus]|uniref:DUF4232 domain-containing protein n=1 Tax=Streptomyces actinomycinicus TaxID=1695166 RepID=A0A937JRH1_9ACTN|nr:DUF4232 domain-containing protein [Streptomyces actinomycinicus]MBL1084508.1 DUF4232 domain-containing protein [Streptomyces actinomycinicus]
MQLRHTGRVTAAALATIAAALSLTACQSGDGTSQAGPSATRAPSSSASGTPAPATASPRPADGTRSASPGPASPAAASPASASPASDTSGGSAKACTAKALEATAYQAADRPSGTGVGAAIVEFTNVSASACVLQGHPTVAGAGNGSPQHSAPLKVTRTGAAPAVRVGPGGKAWVKLTFVQVQGEADGYCVSGATPTVYPTLVVGLPGAGAHQVAMPDGQFAECDNKVTMTAVTAAKPS